MTPGPPIGRAIFFSGEPQSVGHIYRVEHPVAALKSKGWSAEWFPVGDSEAYAKLGACDVVVVFRSVLDASFQEIRARCSDRQIPLVYDTDDLIFDPDLAACGALALLDPLGAAERVTWMARIGSYRKALLMADHATVSTKPLAEAARRICKGVFVLPNVLGPEMWRRADDASRVAARSARDGEARLMFASGTSTHHRDFREASEAIARVLARNSGASLTILGELETAFFPELAPFSDRIEIRPRVPFPALFPELARADVNLCPLEQRNPFCEAKSAVRCLAASAVGVPSIVSPSAPLLEAVENGKSGLVARNSTEWESALERLITDAHFRLEMGQKTSMSARRQCNFEDWSSRLSQFLGTLCNTEM
jgi:glycosyltransferase involved in cell wall biosynthesis